MDNSDAAASKPVADRNATAAYLEIGRVMGYLEAVGQTCLTQSSKLTICTGD
jgi:hypothetical protein